MTVPLRNKTMIRCTSEAFKYYNALCKGRPGVTDEREEALTKQTQGLDAEDDNESESEFEQFTDAPQAFYCAAVIGHLIQQGKRPSVSGELKDLLRRAEQWDRPDRDEIKRPLTSLAKLHYEVSDPDEVLQVVSELAEVGIRQIYDEVKEYGQFDFQSRIAELRESGKSADF
jgi:hypothetical protein